MQKRTFELWLAVNDDGDAAVSLEGGTEALIEEAGGAAVRTVKLTVQMAVPQVIETEVEVPDEAVETHEVKAETA